MKNFFRKLLAVSAHLFGLWHLLYRLVHPLSGRHLLVAFTYHRVIDGNKPARLYMFYEKGLDAAVFARHLRFIKKYYHLADLNEFSAIVTGDKPLRRHTALITFDDADSEYIEHAFPVVQAHACPVTMFAPTGFVETARKFWHVRVSDIMRNVTPESWRRMQEHSAQLPDEVAEAMAAPFPDGENQKAALSRLLNARLDRLDHRRVDEIIAAWEALVERNDTLDIHCLDWSQLKHLADHDTSIQSHTVTHRKLAGLPTEEIEEELAASRAHLEQRLGEAAIAICYPQGSISDAVIDLARKTGYTLGFTTRPGVCPCPAAPDNLLRLPRHGLEARTDVEINLSLGKIALGAIFAGRS